MNQQDETLAKLEANDRAVSRMVLGWLIFCLVLAAIFGLAFISGNAAILQDSRVQTTAALLIGLLFVFSFIRFAKRFRPTEDAFESDILHKRIDRTHRVWRWTLAYYVVLMGFIFYSLGHGLVRGLARNTPEEWPYMLLVAATVIFVALLFSAQTLLGPGGFSRRLHTILNDEFVRDLRARTARVGYVVAILALSMALLISVWQPAMALEAIIWAIYAAYALPTLYYIIADWRAAWDNRRDG